MQKLCRLGEHPFYDVCRDGFGLQIAPEFEYETVVEMLW